MIICNTKSTQSYKLLMADLRQDFFFHLVGTLMEHFHEGT